MSSESHFSTYGENNTLLNTIALRKTLSEVLTLLRSEKVDAISSSLNCILKFFGVDRVFIGYFENEGNGLSFIHETFSEGIQNMPSNFFSQLSIKDLPWWASKLKRDEYVITDDVTDMPFEAFIEKRIMQKLHIQSQLVIPSYHEKKINGFIGLDTVDRKKKWNALDIENLRLFSDLLSLAIEQARTREQLQHSSKEALKSEAKFRIIFDRLPWGVEIYDEGGYLIDMNPMALDIFGTTKEKILGINLFENPIIPYENKQRILQGEEIIMEDDYMFESVHEDGYFETGITKSVKHLWGKCIPLKDSDDTIFGYIFLEHDTTEEYNRNEQMQASLAKLKTAVDTGDAFIWELNLETDELTVDFGLNNDPAYLQELESFKNGYADGTQSFFETIHPDDYERVVINGFDRLIAGDIDSFSTIFRRVYGGKTIWYNCNVRTYMYNDEGKPSRIVSYMMDVTKNQENELELIKVKEADKLKTAFMANMSHEIRTPLNAIVGFSNVLADMYDNEQTHELVALINKNNGLLLQLVNDILDFSKIETGELQYKNERVDMQALCMELIEEQTEKVPEGIEFVFDTTSPSLCMYSDSERIKQVIRNLLNNAFKFTEEGSVTLKYEETPDNYMLMQVIDTGIGINENNADKVFDNFFKANIFKQGVGLGLTISKTIVEALGGTIGVMPNKEQGRGTVFWIKLPISPQP